ncbi:MAG: GNAT family N-acetyltransferase [Halioglobus sp.]
MILREFDAIDLEPLTTLLGNQQVSKYLSSRMPYPYTQQDAQWWITTGSKQGYVRAITQNDELLGCIGVDTGLFEERRSGELGYWLGQPHWGKGIATAAVTQITAHMFTHTDLVRLVAPVFAPNLASMRVLEKCGYTQEGIARKACYKDGAFYDKHIYAKIHP